MITGFRKALELGAQIIVKIDGDGQMDINHLPDLIAPLRQGKADYAKGNRFRDFAALRRMPLIRRVGNIGLGFLAKAATGYWNLFDPTNGFVAIRGDTLAQLPLDQIDRTLLLRDFNARQPVPAGRGRAGRPDAGTLQRRGLELDDRTCAV